MVLWRRRKILLFAWLIVQTALFIGWDLNSPSKHVVLMTNFSDDESQHLKNSSYERFNMNEYLSSLISLDRKLPDYRHKECRSKSYPVDDLPQTSVIICFHNEGLSLLLRTVHSVLNRSPSQLLKEIILVDDNSTMPHLREPLEELIAKLSKVRILRLPKREGLIRARIIGAKQATAPVITYLDSHCECAKGWLEPLLYRIYKYPDHLVCPQVNSIHKDTLTFENTAPYITTFNWMLFFDFRSAIPSNFPRRRLKGPSEPLETPVIVGGEFTIAKQLFEKLGWFDPGFDVWGGENLELPFKVWMCGGAVEILPCSIVGHVFRPLPNYGWSRKTIRRNNIRLAEVWMDDYAKYFYSYAGISHLEDIGDVFERKALRRRLNCHSFEWYLDNVYPELYKPIGVIAYGRIRNMMRSTDGSFRCLDKKTNQMTEVGLYYCHWHGYAQFWMLTAKKEIRSFDYCLLVVKNDVTVGPCNRRPKLWTYVIQNQHILYGNYCLEALDTSKTVALRPCSDELRQKWIIENIQITKDDEGNQH